MGWVYRVSILHILLAYASGLFCAQFLEFFPSLPLLPLPPALCWLLCRRQRWSALPLIVFFWALGIAFHHLSFAPPQDAGHIRALAGGERPVTVEGSVLAVGGRPFGRSVIDLEARRAGTEGILAPVRGKVRLYLDEESPSTLPGDAIRFRGRLRLPRLFGTPGEFDYPRHLAGQGVFVVASLDHAREIVSFGEPPGGGGDIRPERWRSGLARFIDSHLSPPSASLVKALVIGDKGGITPQQRELLARGGVSHLFAISGLHLGLVALFLYTAALSLYRLSEPLMLLVPPRRMLPLALLPLLLGYLLLTGNALPTCRAFLAILAGTGLTALSRRTHPLRLLSAAALLILLAEPPALFEPSFQLSFAGVLGILLLLPRWRARLDALPRPLRWGAVLLLTTLAATAATTPLVLLHFHLLAPAGLLTNLLAVPAIGFLAVPMGLLGALLAPLWASGGALLLEGCGAVTEAVLRVVCWIVSWPQLAGWNVYLPPRQLVGVALLCTLPFVPGVTRRAWMARLLLPAAGLVLIGWPGAPPRGLSVTAFSVGQGDAILVTRSNGRNYLVDGGGIHSETFDVGERLLAPALGRLGVGTLEAVVLTHDQLDHRQGLRQVLEAFAVREFWSTEEPEELHPSLAVVLQRRKVPIVPFSAGWNILEETTETTLALFVPAGRTGNPNDRSLVFYLRQGCDGVLLTGDLETPGVIELLATPTPGPVTLLKLPHHGSRNSSTHLLLDRFHPKLTFVSVGAGNPFHFPHAEVLADLDARHIPLWRTDRRGSLRFLSEGEGWRVQHWQRGVFR